MASGKVLFCLALLGFLNAILAEESSAQSQSEHRAQNGEAHDIHDVHDAIDRASFLSMFPFGNVLSQFANSTSGLPFPFNGFSTFLNSLNSQREAGAGETQDHSNDSEAHGDRFFFKPLFPRLTGCNYTTNPGLSCYGCQLRLRCLRSNVGIIQRCPFLLPYCSGNGTCSSTQGDLC